MRTHSAEEIRKNLLTSENGCCKAWNPLKSFWDPFGILGGALEMLFGILLESLRNSSAIPVESVWNPFGIRWGIPDAILLESVLLESLWNPFRIRFGILVGLPLESVWITFGFPFGILVVSFWNPVGIRIPKGVWKRVQICSLFYII